MGEHEVLEKYLKQSRVKKLYNRVKREFGENGPIAHNWDHIYRDLINAIWIGESAGADMEIVIPAVILHDVGFLYDPDPTHHPEIGAEKCLEWLDDWSEEEKKRISDCIKTHKGKYKEYGNEPESLEAKVVYDADMIEKAGAIGVLQGTRTFVEFAETSKPEFKSLLEIAKYLGAPREVNLYTEKGKEIMKRRGGYSRDEFFQKAIKELEEYE